MDSGVRPKTRPTVATTPSPVRCQALGDDIVRDGLVDMNQLNYILRNPELPKSRLQMKAILRQYNEEKCKAITLSRLQYTESHLFGNTGLNTGYHCGSRSATRGVSSARDSLDLDQLADYEVKLSQLPHDLLINILGETFTRYENQINDQNEIQTDESGPETSATNAIKVEVLSDSEDDCVVIDNNEAMSQTVDNLKQNLNQLMSEYESIENEEKEVISDLRLVSDELENKLGALRECIELCETLKQQNICINEKQNDLKNKKLKLKDEIKDINQKLIKLNCFETNSQKVTTETKRTVNIESNNMFKSNHKKRKTTEMNQIMSNKRVNNELVVEISDTEDISKSTSIEDNLVNNQTETLSQSTNLLNNSLQNANSVKKVNVNNNKNKVIGDKPSTQSSKKVLPNRSAAETPVVTPLIHIANTITEVITRLDPPVVTPTLPDIQMPSNNLVENSSLNTTPQLNHSLESHYNYERNARNHRISDSRRNRRNLYNYNKNTLSNNTYSYDNNNDNLLEVTHHINSPSINFVPQVCCVYATDSQLFVGLECGYVNRYNLDEDCLQFSHQYPRLDSDITALYYSEKYNYLYCGTAQGVFAFFNQTSNDLNYDKIDLIYKRRPKVTCFEISLTILYIGLSNGWVHRFGLMSNKMVNKYGILDSPVIGLKLMNDLSDRIVVYGRNEISIRNSVDGSLLTTLDKDNKEFISANLFVNRLIVCFNVPKQCLHYFNIYDENIKTITNSFHHNSYARFATVSDKSFYILNHKKELFCFDLEKSCIEWSIQLKTAKQPVCMIAKNQRVIFGMPFGKVLQIVIDTNSPFVCHSYGCGLRFPRICDIFDHFHHKHALPFYRMQAIYFHCPWIGCGLKISNTFQCVPMIVEHMKTHVD